MTAVQRTAMDGNGSIMDEKVDGMHGCQEHCPRGVRITGGWLAALVAALVVVGVLRGAQAVAPTVSAALSAVASGAAVLAVVVVAAVSTKVSYDAVHDRRERERWAGIVRDAERAPAPREAAALPVPARALEGAPVLRVDALRVDVPAREPARRVR